MNTTFVKAFSAYAPNKRFWRDPVDNIIYRLRDILKEHYDEIRLTLSNPANAVRPYLGDLENELLISLFTLSLKLKDNLTETIKEVA